MNRTLVAALLLLAGIASSCGDGHECTLIGCNSGVEVTFVPALTTPGTYTVDVVIDGVTIRCDATLPLRPDATDGCHAQGPLLYLSGSALPAGQHRLPGMHLPTTTASAITIVVQRDGAEVARSTFSPTFASSYPNGKACDVNPCVTASATLPTR